MIEPAWRRGFDANRVDRLGLRTQTERDLLHIIILQDCAPVTNKAVAFRSRFQAIERQPGVVLLVQSVRRLQQVKLFQAALDRIRARPDMDNRALDVSFARDLKATVVADDLPDWAYRPSSSKFA